MKSQISLLTLFVSAALISSCKKEDSNNQDPDVIKTADYSSSISQDRINLAKKLVSAFSINPKLLCIATTECAKRFDGDNDVLCKDLFSKSVEMIKSTGNTFGELIGISQNSSNSSLKSAADGGIDFDLLTKDSLTQIYFCRGRYSKDTTNIDGIVVLPQPFHEKTDKRVVLIKNDGTKTTILESENEDKNYLVVSRNERVGTKKLSNNFVHSLSTTTTVVPKKKTFVITSAWFTNIDALRTVESRWLGEPEVFTEIYAAEYSNGKWNPLNSCITWSENWFVTHIGWQETRHNDQRNELPNWYALNMSLYQKLHWYEDDGDIEAHEETYSTDVTDANGNKSTISLKDNVPYSTSHDEIYTSSIYYNDVTSQTYNWGIIHFVVESVASGGNVIIE